MFHLVTRELMVTPASSVDIIIARNLVHANAIVLHAEVKSDKTWIRECIRDLEDTSFREMMFGSPNVEKIIVHVSEPVNRPPFSLVVPTTIVRSTTQKIVRFEKKVFSARD